jgi:hypothetical protein
MTTISKTDNSPCYSPLASSIFAPAVANAAEEFGTKGSVLKSLGVTAYLFGYGVSTKAAFIFEMVS